MQRITRQTVDIGERMPLLLDPGLGAVITFEGRVRGSEPGFTVLSLDYDCYDRMAETQIDAILVEALQRWPGGRAEAVHRVGSLQAGDIALWVGVAWPHRGEAFEACQFIIDAIKTRVPIWKKEVRSDGQRSWMDGEALR